MDRPNFLNDSILVYGTFSPLVLCYENGTEEADAMFISDDDEIDQTCSSEVAISRPNIQPGIFAIRVPMEVTGQHRVYVAVGICSSQTRSIMFDVNRKSWSWCVCVMSNVVYAPLLLFCS